jgi:hypothetical protein
MKNYCSRHFLKEFLIVFLSTLGAIALILETIDIFFSELLDKNTNILLGVIIVSFSVSLIRVFPLQKFSRKFSEPDCEVEVKVGDLFAQETDLVIGMSDTFDTDLGAQISPRSIQGQFLEKCFNSDATKLRKFLDEALKNEKFEADLEKIEGNNQRYPIGTIAIVDSGNQKFYCSAYSKMKVNLEAESSVEAISQSLSVLWNKVREKSAQEEVSMPVIGAGLSRLNVSYDFLIKNIIFSFFTASKQKIVTKKLTIVIHPSDLEKVDLSLIRSYLKNI